MWTTPKELRTQLLRIWDCGVLLRAGVNGTPCLPLRLACKVPASGDITERFEQVRAWATELAGTQALRVEWKEVQHWVQGPQRIPRCWEPKTGRNLPTCPGLRQMSAPYMTIFVTTAFAKACAWNRSI